MSGTMEREAISEALRIIDLNLGQMQSRELVSTAEVSDLLLDMRSVLAVPELALDAAGVN